MSTTQELLAANERYDALVKRIEALAFDFESNIDWSNGRSNYGDNAAWEQASQSLLRIVRDA